MTGMPGVVTTRPAGTSVPPALITTLDCMVAVARSQVLMFVKRPMNLATGVINPLMFLALLFLPRLSTITPPQATSALSGALLASLWSSTMWSGAGILRRERWQGTLAASVTGRLHPLLVIVAKTVGGVIFDTGLIVASCAVFILAFRVRLQVVHPGAVAIGLVSVVVCGTASSLLIGGVLVLSRYARQLTMAFGTPVLLLGGMLIPASMLPAWIGWISYAVNLSWLHRFMASLAGPPAWGALLIGYGITLAYVVGAILLFGRMLARARREATLELI